MAIAPPTKISEFLDFGMIMLCIVLDWKTLWVVNSNIASEAEEDSRNFKSKELRI